MTRIRWFLASAALAGCGGAAGEAEVLADLEFSAFVDADGDGLSANDPTTTVHLSDFLATQRPGTKILMLNAAAGWCEPCQREAAALPAFRAAYEPRGVAIVSAVFQDQNGDPADEGFVQVWADTFQLPIPVLIDGAFQTDAYFDAQVMPANLFVDAETGEILLVATGAEQGDDPLRSYRELLDAELADR